MGITVFGALIALYSVGVRNLNDATAAVALSAQTPPATTPAQAQTAAVDPTAPGSKLLRHYLGLSDDQDIDLRGARLDVMVATLPDPFDSHLDWAFDQALGSIRRAYESAGFVADRFALPWNEETRADTPANRLMRESAPGVFLFRHRTELALELLYVVGEVPTSGVNQAAFEVVLRERDELQRCGLLPARDGEPDTSYPERLRVLGPFFSGSAPSLRDVLQRWLAKHGQRSVDVVTGAATSAGNEKILSGRISKTRNPDATQVQSTASTSENTLWPSSRIRFRATVHPDKTLLAVLEHDVLRDLGLCVNQVAILNENSTQYGASGAKTIGLTISDSEGGPTHTTRESEGKPTEWFTLPFPMNLTSLRAAYEREWQSQTNSASALGATKVSRVELSLEEQDRTRETPRPMSPLTAPVTDLAMNEIVRTLASRNIKLVVLFATDVRDKLLLGAEIAKRLPDVQLVTTESNLLYLRSDFNAALRGMLVLSSYPLFVRAPDWNHQSSERQELSFSSDGAQGTYNAALLLLGLPQALADYGPPVANKGGDLKSPTSQPASIARVPPVWVATVGKTSMLPVRLGSYLDETNVYPVSVPFVNLRPPEEENEEPVHLLPFGLTLVLGLAIAILCLRAGLAALRRTTKLAEILARLANGPQDGDKTRGRRIEVISLALHTELYEGLLILALVSLHLPGSALLWQATDESPAQWGPFVRASCVVIMFLALVGAGLRSWRALTIARRFRAEGLCFVCCGEFESGGERLMWILENVARLLVVLLSLLYVYWSVVCAWNVYQLGSEHLRSEHPTFELFAYRAMLVDEGVSPLLPLFFIGVGLATWCCWHLRRIALLREYKPIERLPEERPVSTAILICVPRMFAGISLRPCYWKGLGSAWKAVGDLIVDPAHGAERASKTSEVRKRLFRVVPDAPALALLVFLGFAGVWLWSQREPTLESMVHTTSGRELDYFDVLLGAGILALLFTTAWAAYRFVVVWLALRAYLRQHDHEAMQKAWKDLQGPLGNTASLQLWAPSSGANIRALLAPRWRALLGPNGACSGLRAEHGGVKETWEQMDGDLKLHAQYLTRLRTEIADAESQCRAARSGTGEPEPCDVTDWLARAHQTVALELVDWIEWVMQQLRTLAVFLLASLVLTTALLSCYPFHPQSLFRLAFLFLLVGTTGSLLFVIVQMNRDAVLSRITGTDPGQLTWDRTLITNLLLFGVLPLATLASSQVPAVRDLLFAWVDPLLKAVVHA